MVLIGDSKLYKAMRLAMHVAVLISSVAMILAVYNVWGSQSPTPFIQAFFFSTMLDAGFSFYDQRYAGLRKDADDPERERRREILSA